MWATTVVLDEFLCVLTERFESTHKNWKYFCPQLFPKTKDILLLFFKFSIPSVGRIYKIFLFRGLDWLRNTIVSSNSDIKYEFHYILSLATGWYAWTILLTRFRLKFVVHYALASSTGDWHGLKTLWAMCWLATRIWRILVRLLGL